MSELSIRNALETRLKAISNGLPTQWENAAFSPPAAAPYQAVFVLPADPENPTMGDSFYRARGIFQVNLYYPLAGGSGMALAKAESIKAWFPRGSSYVANGVTVTIERTPGIGVARIVNGRYCVPVSIRYYANILS